MGPRNTRPRNAYERPVGGGRGVAPHGPQISGQKRGGDSWPDGCSDLRRSKTVRRPVGKTSQRGYHHCDGPPRGPPIQISFSTDFWTKFDNFSETCGGDAPETVATYLTPSDSQFIPEHKEENRKALAPSNPAHRPPKLGWCRLEFSRKISQNRTSGQNRRDSYKLQVCIDLRRSNFCRQAAGPKVY